MIQLYAAVYWVCMPALSILWSSSTCPFFIILLWIQCTKLSELHPSTICFWSFFFFYISFFFVCQTWRIASLPFDATSSHCLFFVLSNKRLYSLQTIIVFKEMSYWTSLHAGHVWFFFSFCAWRFLSDDSSMAFILHLWPPHFFGTATKKWQDFPPTPHPPCNLYKCISAVLKCTTSGCQWMRFMHCWWKLIGGDPRGKKKGLLRRSPIPFLLLILLFKRIPLCIWQIILI